MAYGAEPGLHNLHSMKPLTETACRTDAVAGLYHARLVGDSMPHNLPSTHYTRSIRIQLRCVIY